MWIKVVKVELALEHKRRYIHSKLKDASPGQTWRFLETIGVCDVTTKQCDPELDLNAINSQFSSPPLLLNSTSKALSLLSLSTSTFTDCEPFKFIELTEDEVRKDLLAIHSRAVGCRGVREVEEKITWLLI
ncbi:hypothetical protein ACJJTC_017757 [Scirpophaga incertulas]